MNYYKVRAKCGHVGRNNYIIKPFFVKANDGKEAAKIVRNTPRVKHDHKYAIIDVKEKNLVCTGDLINPLLIGFFSKDLTKSDHFMR